MLSPEEHGLPRVGIQRLSGGASAPQTCCTRLSYVSISFFFLPPSSLGMAVFSGAEVRGVQTNDIYSLKLNPGGKQRI